ncbi:NADH dehydrogenase [Allorhodopirellula solitaria]|uniref:NADH dehydrogenase n=2 Tax=Allorhodopirellula solitaria TaxID=2527987 RepID=A0A5C5XX88_9BACT|nr:NADH dehydrogenase [Allorhodopirellula solitaria]
MEIELAPLVARAGAELILDEVVGLDAQSNTIHFAARAPLTFNALSVGIGSVPAGWEHFDSSNLLPIKPMQTFIERLDERFERCWNAGDEPPKIAVVGGGAAGVEIAFCVRARLAQFFPKNPPSVHIVSASDEIAGGMNRRSIRKLRRELSRQSIGVTTGFRVTEVGENAVADQNGRMLAADVVLWATDAVAPPLLGKLNLPTDKRGFLATEATLRTTAGHPIFAVGDSGTILANPSPKAGVYAVRQAPVLWHNLRALIDGSPMIDFDPQQDFLKILNTGQGRALLQYKILSFHAGWCWKLKVRIDEGFVSKYRV